MAEFTANGGIRLWVACALATLSPVLFPGFAGADIILLQNTQEVSGTATSFDEDGVLMNGKQLIGWGEILEGDVAKEQQPRFDKLLKQLGEPLFRIRARLRTGNYLDALPQAEAVYPRFAGRDSPTAYMVFQALMWGRMAAGKREAAVEPLLRCYIYLKKHNGDSGGIPGARKLQCDKGTCIAEELQMVWLDKEAAKAALPKLVPVIRNLKPPVAGAYLYYATLAFAAGDSQGGKAVLRLIEKLTASPRETELATIAAAMNETLNGDNQKAVATLAATQIKASEENRPLCTFWLGYAESKRGNVRQQHEGVLRLLHLPALYGKQYPEISAAALHRGMQVLEATGDVQASVALRGELRSRYPETAPAIELANKKKSKPQGK